MASEIKVDTIVNAGGDNDTGIDLATNDQILLKVANATRLTMNSTGQTTIVGEGGTNTTSVQQGLAKAYAQFTTVTSSSIRDSSNISSLGDPGTGETNFAFTNNMANVNYTVLGTAGRNTGSNPAECWVYTGNTTTAGGYQIETMNTSDNYQDQDYVAHSVHGDLA